MLKGFTLTKKERFMEVLKTFDKPVTVATWTKKVAELYPSILSQINSKTNEQMTLNDLALGIGLKLSKGEFPKVLIYNIEPYRVVEYLSEVEEAEVIKKSAKKDIEPILLEAKIKGDIEKLTEAEKYRLEELSSIVNQLNRYFSLSFALHHATALMSKEKEGRHQADNLQILTREHGLIKKDGESKFSIEEQKAYIKRIISIQMMVNKELDINLTDEVLEMLLDRLEKVY